VVHSKTLVASLVIAVCIFIADSPIATAQNFQRPTNTRIQLPVISVFNVRTTVMVPDGGIMSLGGVSRHAEGSISRGIPGMINRPFTNRGLGFSSSASQATVKVTVLSNQEMSDDVLAAVRASDSYHPNGSAAVQRKAAFLSRNIGRSSKRR